MRLELFTDDVPATVQFYTRVLGFTDLTPDPATYHALRLGENRISIQSAAELEPQHPLAQAGRRGLGIEIVLEVDDIQALYQAVSAQYPAVSPLVQQPWGLSDFRVIDPNGYYLRLTNNKDSGPSVMQ